MKKILYPVLVLLLGVAACAKAPVAGGGEPKTEDEKTLYALGLVVGDNLATFSLNDKEIPFVQAGIADAALKHERKVDVNTYGPKLQALAQARASAGASAAKQSGSVFLEKAAAEKGAVKAPSGFVIQEIKAGAGATPKATDKVKVHYKGTLTDGTVFDSSIDRGQPAVFPLDHVIPCWGQAMQMMKVGGKSRIVCPPELAYGDRGAPPRIGPGATLVFEVELLSIEK